MVFSSLIFLYAFLPLSLIAYYLAPTRKAQNTSLLIFSIIFYAWGEPKYVLLLMFMALTSWFCALRVASSASAREAKMWVSISAAIDIALIGFFKYAGLFCSIFGEVPDFVRSIALPIGISFYTFQLLTYVIDVYRGDAEAQESYWNVLLYASLFHQCIAGPIVRYKTVADELFVHREEGPDLLSGIRRFAVGLAKKTLLANPCGALADQLLLETSAASDASLFAQNLASLKSLTVLGSWVGVLAFTLQIYLDFSAYSDMAIGMGRMIGLHYLENFDYPYISKSVTEFWRRWHISLSTWFRDYVYIPLGGNRCSRARNILNLFLVWALTGLWHGANWTFIAWGLWFFVLLIGEKFLWGKALSRLPSLLQHVYAMLLVILSWVLFRADDIGAALCYMSAMFGRAPALCDSRAVYYALEFWPELLLCCIAALPVKNLLETALEKRNSKLSRGILIVGPKLASLALLALSYCRLVTGSFNPFIYFRF